MSAEPADGEAAADSEAPRDADAPAGADAPDAGESTPIWRRGLRLAVLLVFLAVVAVFVVYAVPQVIGADHSYVVLTASMSPAIEPGDAVIVGEVEPAAVEDGDVITFYRSADEPPVTHRVIGITETADGYLYETKGDANAEPDANPVAHENVVGAVAVTIPYLGHVIQLANTTEGFLALVIVPFGLLLLSEAYSLVGSSRREGDSEPGDEDTEDAAMGDDNGLVLTPATLRAAIAVLAVVAPASAYVALQYPAAVTVAVAVAASASLLVAVGIRVVGGGSGGGDAAGPAGPEDPNDPGEADEFGPDRAEAGEPVGDGAGGTIDEPDAGADSGEGSR